MRYRPKKTEYMFKIIKQMGSKRKGPYASGFTYRNDKRWHEPIKGKLISCVKGYHFFRMSKLPYWLYHNPPCSNFRLYLVKVDMDGAVGGYDPNKVVARNFKFVCELDVSRGFLGNDVYAGHRYIYSAELKESVEAWGLDIRDNKIIGEYVKG